MLTTREDIYNEITSKMTTTHQKVMGCMNLAKNLLDPREVLNYTEEDWDFLNNKDYICDLGEGNGVFVPRYTLPNFWIYINEGCKYLELDKPEDLDELLNGLLILYMNTPSVGDFPVYVGDLDKMIEPFLTNDEENDFKKIKRFLHHIDKTVPSSFCHANIGPEDTKAGRHILKAALELQSPTPNITIKYDEDKTSDDFAHECLKVSLKTAKPSFANDKMYNEDLKGYGIASCYNALPVGGGGYTLPRIKMGNVAHGTTSLDQCINELLPKVVKSMLHIMDERISFLVEKTNFFDENFMVKEKFLDADRFVGMFGFVGLADAVNHFLKLENINETFGQSERGDEIGQLILNTIDELIKQHEGKYSPLTNNKYLLHAQVGTSHSKTDNVNTPAHRIRVGEEPDLPDHIINASLYQKYFVAGVGDLFNFDQSYENKPEPILDIIKGAFKMNIRYISPYLVNQELVRVTGYLVKRSEVEKIKEGKAAFRDTATFGQGMEETANVLTGRKVRKDGK